MYGEFSVSKNRFQCLNFSILIVLKYRFLAFSSSFLRILERYPEALNLQLSLSIDFRSIFSSLFHQGLAFSSILDLGILLLAILTILLVNNSVKLSSS